MKIISLGAFLLLVVASNGLSQEYDYAQEINEQVWIPFITAYGAYDTEAFMAVHSRDLVRVVRDNGDIRGFEEYQENMSKSASRSKEQRMTRHLQLAFTERHANARYGFEVGYYKAERVDEQGVSQVFYGKFHVVLRREEGRWKILVDSDTSLNATVSEKDFRSGELLSLN